MDRLEPTSCHVRDHLSPQKVPSGPFPSLPATTLWISTTASPASSRPPREQSPVARWCGSSHSGPLLSRPRTVPLHQTPPVHLPCTLGHLCACCGEEAAPLALAPGAGCFSRVMPRGELLAQGRRARASVPGDMTRPPASRWHSRRPSSRCEGGLAAFHVQGRRARCETGRASGH